MEQVTLCDPAETTPARPDGGCRYYGVCENMTPGGTETGNALCVPCLDAFRQRGHGRDDYDREAYLRDYYAE